MFDGDEMNKVVPQSQQARAELIHLMSTGAQFISSANSSPMLTIKQDNMLAGYLYTLNTVKVKKTTFMDACCMTEFSIEEISSKMESIRNVHKWLGMLDNQIIEVEKKRELAKENLEKLRLEFRSLKIKYDVNKDKNIKQLKNKYKRDISYTKNYLKNNIIDEASEDLLYTGHGLFSMLFPEDFCFENSKMKIVRGVMISGTITTPTLNTLIHHIYKDYGADYACDFVTYYQRFTNILITTRGFSVGIEDCLTTNQNMIDKEREKAFIQIKSIMETEIDLDIQESKIQNVLNNSIDIGERIIREGISKDNNFLHMIMSGAKGKMFNYVNCVNSVGQQNITGKRAQKDYGGRTLPCYKKQGDYNYDDIPSDEDGMKTLVESRAFISSSFYDGLTAPEFFFLAQGGREGLCDIAVKTSKCGYMSRRMLKNLEDVKIGYNNSVINSFGTIIQFSYGEDNMNSAELIRTEKYGLQCSDITHIVNSLNIEYEWTHR